MVAGGQDAGQTSGAAPGPRDVHGPESPDGQQLRFPVKLAFLGELKRRNVFRVAILYLIACWVILEPTHVVFHMLEVPQWANRLVIILMAIGFPLVLVFSWVYEVTPEGLKPTVEVDPAKSITDKTGQKLNQAIIVVLSLAVLVLLTDKFWLSERGAPEPQQTSSQDVADRAAAPSAQNSSGGTTAAVSDKSIAVLPFVDMSQKKDQEYFSDGLSEELIDRLSHASDLKVIARTSSFAFKGKNEDARTIAAKLGAAHLLEGSVRRDGRQVRITAQLIRASDGAHLWSQTYDRSASGIFKVQDEIAGTVARALQVAMATGIHRDQGEETNFDAYNLLLQGDYLVDRGSKDDLFKAEQLYKQAVKLDPKYAKAWLRLAVVYNNESAGGGWIPIRQGRAAVWDAVHRALALTPNDARAYRILAMYYSDFDQDWAAAQKELERAHSLDPSYLRAAIDLAWLREGMYGRFDNLIELMRKDVAQNPLDVNAIWWLGYALMNAGRLEQAVETYRRALTISPSSTATHSFLAFSLLYLNRSDEALTEAQQEPEEAWKLAMSAAAQWALGRRSESTASLNEAERKFASTNAYAIAMAHAYRGEVDAGCEWLERAYHNRELAIQSIKIDRMLTSLRGNPRYKVLLHKLKLDDDGPPA